MVRCRDHPKSTGRINRRWNRDRAGDECLSPSRRQSKDGAGDKTMIKQGFIQETATHSKGLVAIGRLLHLKRSSG